MTKRTLTIPMRLTLSEPKLNKQNTLEEYCEQLLDENDFYTVQARCFEVLVMNDEEYNTFKNSLLQDYDFLTKLEYCGTGSDYETDKQNLWELTQEETEQWREQSFRVATMIFNKDTNEKFYINTEGYAYARYCLFD